MKNETRKLIAWNDIKDLIISDNIEPASEEMSNLLDSIKEDSGDEETLNQIDEFTSGLNEKYSARAEEIDSETEGKTPDDMKRRRRAYTQLERWRVSQLFALLRGIMNEKVIEEMRE